MYWQEQNNDGSNKVPERVVDVVFKLQCRSVPMDHAWPLSEAVAAALPWFADEPQAGMHIIHGADSGNGWNRPEGANEVVYLTRRSRLELRVPEHRIAETLALTGSTLDIAANPMLIGEAKKRPLSALTTLYSRYLRTDPEHTEEQFLQLIQAELKRAGIRVRKMLPGRTNLLYHPDGDWITRSLMIADLDAEDAIALQEHGIGGGKKMGCGLFIPHKSIKNTEPQA